MLGQHNYKSHALDNYKSHVLAVPNKADNSIGSYSYFDFRSFDFNILIGDDWQILAICGPS